jgi:hypothetical protein
MKNEQEINEVIAYLRSKHTRELIIDQKAIEAECKLLFLEQTSIAIKILTFIGSFLACLTFIGFLFLTKIFESELGTLITGLFMLISAVVLSRISKTLITDTFSTSVYLIGLLLFGFGLGGFHLDENTICCYLLLIGIISLFTADSYILSFISVLIINGSILSFLLVNSWYNGIHFFSCLLAIIVTFIHLKEAAMIQFHPLLSKLYNPIRIAYIISFLTVLAFYVTRDSFFLNHHLNWLSSIGNILCILYVIYLILKKLAIHEITAKLILYGISCILLASTILTPSTSGSLLLILLSFWVTNQAGFVIGIIAFIYFIFQYYYDLTYTLLIKSILMFTTGLLFLLLYVLLSKKIKRNENI